jgi:hypothetical protein
MNVVVVEAVDLTPYGKPALRKGRLPTGLGKPAAGFPQLNSFDDDELILLIYTLTGYRGTFTDLWGTRAGNRPSLPDTDKTGAKIEIAINPRWH